MNESGKLITDEEILNEKLDQIVVHDLKRIRDPNLKQSILDKIYYDKGNRILLLNTKEILAEYDSAKNLSNILVFKGNLLKTNINLPDFSQEIHISLEEDKKQEKIKKEKESKMITRINQKKIMKLIEPSKIKEEKKRILDDLKNQQISQTRIQQRNQQRNQKSKKNYLSK